jgi:hypothetical protein
VKSDRGAINKFNEDAFYVSLISIGKIYAPFDCMSSS